MIIAIVSAYLFVMYFLRVIYLLFRPRFLPGEIFGNSSTFTVILGYLAIMFIMLFGILTGLGLVTFNVESDFNFSFRNYNKKGLLIAVLIGIIGASISPYLLKRRSNKEREQ